MTHFVRPLAIAERLDPIEWEVFFWTPRRYHGLVRRPFSRLEDLSTLHPEAFLKALATGAVLYEKQVIESYVQDDLAILRDVQPDLVVGDMRLSLCISAPMANVPFASIINAHWSPYWRQPAIVPELPLTRWVAPRFLNPIFRCVQPYVYWLQAKPFNEVRKSLRLSPGPGDIRRIYTAGDLVFYPDVPEFVPLSGAPAHHHFIGVPQWKPPFNVPEWWDGVMSSSEQKVFVSLGSSGPLRALPHVTEALQSLNVTGILASSGRSVSPGGHNLHVADLLPYEETAKRSVCVVSHGGTGGLYPTLAAGVPMLAIPSNFDMHLSANLLEKSGAGLSVRVEQASVPTLRTALDRLIREPKFRVKASQLAEAIARYDAPRLFAGFVDNWLQREPA